MLCQDLEVTHLPQVHGSYHKSNQITQEQKMICHSTLQSRNCVPVWCCSAHTHLIDSAINDALRIVTGCQRSTPADNLPILAGIQPGELRRNGAALSLARRAMEPGHLLHSALTRPSSADARRLKSRHPFVPAARDGFRERGALGRLSFGSPRKCDPFGRLF